VKIQTLAAFVVAVAAASLAGCGGSNSGKSAGDTAPASTTAKPDGQAASSTPDAPQAAAPSAPITTPSGLQYVDLVVGTGLSPARGETVDVHYTGWLTNGSKFDSSKDRGQPFQFILGMGQVIKGWDEGVASMRVGGTRKLTVPPDLAYGERVMGGGLIPANSTLVFEVELLGIR